MHPTVSTILDGTVEAAIERDGVSSMTAYAAFYRRSKRTG
jgi:hypothetical protein